MIRGVRTGRGKGRREGLAAINKEKGKKKRQPISPYKTFAGLQQHFE